MRVVDARLRGPMTEEEIHGVAAFPEAACKSPYKCRLACTRRTEEFDDHLWTSLCGQDLGSAHCIDAILALMAWEPDSKGCARFPV